MRDYDDWPEPVRWALFLPLLFLVLAAFHLFLIVLDYLRGQTGFLVEVGHSIFVAMAFFPLVFGLAPRWKSTVGWCFYVPLILLMALGLFFLSAQGLAVLGLLPSSPFDEAPKWDRTDSLELARTLAWSIVGTLSFRHCLSKERTPSQNLGR